jgi:hypothetical protein
VQLRNESSGLPGGGRKATLATIPEIETAFQRVLEEHTAGSPMDETIKWAIPRKE